ncbi:MAG TPA: EAL domain-containing protein [Pseudomonadales bacterium]|nr:EAL domain-containing protein [Pseudomonadales bacterium]
MTLRRQLFLSLTLMFLALLATSIAINLYNTRRHLHDQMAEHAQDTATFLAFSISKINDGNKKTALEAAINMAFDRGHYDAVIYQDTQGKQTVERRKPVQNTNVPHWFIQWLTIIPPVVNAEVLSGWSQQGSVQVIASPDFAYQELWRVFCQQILLMSLICALAYLLASLALNLLLKPLRKVEEQAAAICERHFIEQQPLPKTRELRQVVEAINHMSRKLKIIFFEQLALTEGLRAQSFLDPVTGLSNRREFNARLQAVADSEAGNSGCLMILQISDFGRYNLQFGHESGDECLRAVASQLQGLTTDVPDAIVSRRAGADFAIYLPRENQERAKTLGSQLIAKIADLAVLFDYQVHIGIACCINLRADHKLLAEADLALRQAQSRGQSGWRLHEEGDVQQIAHEARQWYSTLNRVLQGRQISFHFQPMFLRENNNAVAAEAFCRITLQDKLVCAGIFLPMAERFDMAEAFDRLIIDEIRTRSEAAHCDTPICINLSPRSVRTKDFVDWLASYLEEHPVFARRLIIETSEYLVRTGHEQVHYLCDMLHRHHARLSLDHFGIHSAAFGYLHSLPLDFLKIDRSFIRDIHLNKDNQFYVQSLVQIAHSCEIIILAEGVENALEWDCLSHLGIDGGQGYLLGRPDPKINTART